MRSLLLLTLGLIAVPGAAQPYTYIDEGGTPHYTDTPSRHVLSAPVVLTPLNRLPARAIDPQTDPQALLPERESPPVLFRYTVLEVSGLPEGQALRANNGTFSVQVRVEPPLRAGHRLQLVLDGTPYGVPGRSREIKLDNVDRGEHRLAARILHGNTEVQRSADATFHLQRARLR